MLRELKMMFAHRNGLGSLDLGVEVSTLSIKVTYSIDRGKKRKRQIERKDMKTQAWQRERKKSYHFQ